MMAQEKALAVRYHGPAKLHGAAAPPFLLLQTCHLTLANGSVNIETSPDFTVSGNFTADQLPMTRSSLCLLFLGLIASLQRARTRPPFSSRPRVRALPS